MLGYTSVNPEHPRRDYQRQAEQIASECRRRGLWLVGLVSEHDRPRQRVPERPALGYALGRILAQEASGIVVSDLSRLTHSVGELGRVLEWLSRRGARLVVATLGLDTDEESGRLAVEAIIEISGWERRRLRERTRNGMRAARRKGPASVADYPELRKRIAGMRSGGMTLQAIADQLNAEGVSTVRGGAKWRPSSVHAAAGYQRPSSAGPLPPNWEEGRQRGRRRRGQGTL